MLNNRNSSTYVEFSGQNGNASFNGSQIDVKHTEFANIQVVTTSTTLKGTLKLQANNDPTNYPNAWTDVAGESIAFDASVAQSAMFNVALFGIPFFRVVWVYTSGTGTFDCIVNRKT